jgi:hypothetical protein
VFQLNYVVAHFGENIGVRFGVTDRTEHYYFTFLQFPSSFTTQVHVLKPHLKALAYVILFA